MKSLAVIALVLLFASSPATAAITGYLHLDGIPGESKRADHEDEIDIHDIQWAHTGFPDKKYDPESCAGGVLLSKYVDRSTPGLLAAQYENRRIANATLAVRKDSGDVHLDYLTITMTNVSVSDLAVSSAEVGQLIEESLLICPETFRVEYTVQEEDHSAGDTLSTYVDLLSESVSER